MDRRCCKAEEGPGIVEGNPEIHIARDQRCNEAVLIEPVTKMGTKFPDQRPKLFLDLVDMLFGNRTDHHSHQAGMTFLSLM